MAPAPLTLRHLRADRVLIWCWLPLGGFLMLGVIQAWQALFGEPPHGLYVTLDILWIAVTFSLTFLIAISLVLVRLF